MSDEQLSIPIGPTVAPALAAKLLNVSVSTVKRWAKDGSLRGCFRINPSNPNSRWRIPEDTINEFLKKRSDPNHIPF